MRKLLGFLVCFVLCICNIYVCFAITMDDVEYTEEYEVLDGDEKILTYGSVLYSLDWTLLKGTHSSNYSHNYEEVFLRQELDKLVVDLDMRGISSYDTTLNTLSVMLEEYDGLYDKYIEIIVMINNIWAMSDTDYFVEVESYNYAYGSMMIAYDKGWILEVYDKDTLNSYITYEDFVGIMERTTHLDVSDLVSEKDVITMGDFRYVLSHIDNSDLVNYTIPEVSMKNLSLNAEGIYAMLANLYSSPSGTVTYRFCGTASKSTEYSHKITEWLNLADLDLYDLKIKEDGEYLKRVQVEDGNDIVLTLGEKDSNFEKRETLLSDVSDLALYLYDSGHLYRGATDLELAELIMVWCCDNLEYYMETNGNSAYDILVDGMGVCSGYTSLYNALCKAVGIDSVAVQGEGHVWSAVNLDDTWELVDVTWADSSKGVVNTNMFCASLDYLQSLAPNIEHTLRYSVQANTLGL